MNEIFQELRKCVVKADMVGNGQHCAAVVHRGKIISVGLNKRKTHPLQKLFADRPERQFIHAEIDAISKIKRKYILQDCAVYVLRLSKGNRITNSEPCEGCKKALMFYNIKEIYWTRNENDDWL